MPRKTTAMGLSLAFWFLHWQGELTPSVLPPPARDNNECDISLQVKSVTSPHHSTAHLSLTEAAPGTAGLAMPVLRQG